MMIDIFDGRHEIDCELRIDPPENTFMISADLKLMLIQ